MPSLKKIYILTYLHKMINFDLPLISFSRHEHKFILQLSQVFKRVAAHVQTVVMLLWNLQLHGTFKCQLDQTTKICVHII